MFSTDDTIVAVATPPGHGGIGVVRLSGPEARRIAEGLMSPPRALAPRHATFTRIRSAPSPAPSAQRRAPLDQAVFTWFEAPHSYTGEDVVEISAHGSPVVLRRVVELALRDGGRLAEPGEFTLRAYLNGRMDLVQAEAVADLVNAVTPLQARAAMDQLEGTLTMAVREADALLFDLAARLEASLDFPEEGFHFVTRDQAEGELARVRDVLDALARDGRAGRVVREGSTVVIIGLPNSGKSSLFNALVGASRAIVTDIAGTTRDLVTERVDLAGLPITFVDTAGLRDVGDRVEAEGVQRARDAQAVAALRLALVDGSAPLEAAALGLLDHLEPPSVVVVTKSDLPAAWDRSALGVDHEQALDVSVRTGQGMDALRDRIVSGLTAKEELRDAPAITNIRHLTLVADAQAAVGRAGEALQQGASEELVLAELGAARRALEEIAGRRAPDDLLEHIFSKFCIGK